MKISPSDIIRPRRVRRRMIALQKNVYGKMKHWVCGRIPTMHCYYCAI